MANKFYAKKTIVDDIKFDSKKEASYYFKLKEQRDKGEILDFRIQPEFVLQPGFYYHGKKIRAIKYKADFEIRHNDGTIEVIDVKGSKKIITRDSKMRMKMLQYKLRNELDIEARFEI